MEISITLTPAQYTHTVNALVMRLQRCKDNRWTEEAEALQSVLVAVQEAWKRANSSMEMKEF